MRYAAICISTALSASLVTGTMQWGLGVFRPLSLPFEGALSLMGSMERKNFWKSEYGLRTGWAIALFILISVVAAGILFGCAYLLAHWTPANLAEIRTKLVPGIRLAQSGAVSCGTLLAYFVVCRLSRGGWRQFGLNPAGAWGHLGQGVLAGSLAMSLLVGTLVLTHAMTITYSASTAFALIGSGLLWAAVFALGAFVEEMQFRGYPFFRLSLVKPPIVAAIIMSASFGMAHLGNGGEDLLGITHTVLFGLVCCLAVWRTGSLWWAIGAHAAWNWTQTFVFGCYTSGLTASGSIMVATPAGPAWLSGGATGPEGSLLSILALALMALIIMLTLRPTPRPSQGRAVLQPLKAT